MFGIRLVVALSLLISSLPFCNGAHGRLLASSSVQTTQTQALLLPQVFWRIPLEPVAPAKTHDLYRAAIPPESTESLLRRYRQSSLLRLGGTIEDSAGEGRHSVRAVDLLIEKYQDRIGDVHFAFGEELPDSSNLGPDEWRTIVLRVRQMLAEKKSIEAQLRERGIKPPPCGGILVTMGTDTADIISLMLSYFFTAQTDVPIVVTGAALPLGEKGSDAETNFINALGATRSRSLPPGVYFSWNGDVHHASQIYKFIGSHPRDDQAEKLAEEGHHFIAYGPPAARWNHGYLEKENLLDLPGLVETVGRDPQFGEVVTMVVDMQTPVKVLEDTAAYLLRRKAEGRRVGLLLKGRLTQQNGKSHNHLYEYHSQIDELTQAGIPVLTGSTFSTDLLEGSGLEVLPAHLLYAKAAMKLSILLGADVPAAQIASRMRTDVVGEIPDPYHLPLSHGFTEAPTNNFENPEEAQEVLDLSFPLDAELISLSRYRLLSSAAKRLTMMIYVNGDGQTQLGHASLASRVHDWFEERFPGFIAPVIRLATGLLSSDRPLIDVFERLLTETLRSHLNQRLLRRLAHRYESRSANELVDAILGEWFTTTPALSKFDPVSIIRVWRTSFGLTEAHIPLPNHSETPVSIKEAKQWLAYSVARLSDEQVVDILIQFPHWIARRVLKDALMASHPLLGEIGRAVDEGVRVLIRSRAYRTWTNTRLYLLGNYLMTVGADSEMSPGWKTVLIPKSDHRLGWSA